MDVINRYVLSYTIYSRAEVRDLTPQVAAFIFNNTGTPPAIFYSYNVK